MIIFNSDRQRIFHTDKKIERDQLDNCPFLIYIGKGPYTYDKDDGTIGHMECHEYVVIEDDKRLTVQVEESLSMAMSRPVKSNVFIYKGWTVIIPVK